MATAKTRFVPLVTTTQVADGVTLELTKAEAEALLFITGCIGGVPDTSARGRFDSIRSALREAGVERIDLPTNDSTIHFKN
jgi:hypothetical protein